MEDGRSLASTKAPITGWGQCPQHVRLAGAGPASAHQDKGVIPGRSQGRTLECVRANSFALDSDTGDGPMTYTAQLVGSHPGSTPGPRPTLGGTMSQTSLPEFLWVVYECDPGGQYINDESRVFTSEKEAKEYADQKTRAPSIAYFVCTVVVNPLDRWSVRDRMKANAMEEANADVS